MFNRLRRIFGQTPTSTPSTPPSAQRSRPLPPPEPEPDEIAVPEITVADLRAALDAQHPLLLLDVREVYEWNQVHVPLFAGLDVRHIPMNSVPDRIGELPGEQPIVVMCAHGSRSFGVTHWLIEQGFNARNLSGGITRWAQSGGPVERTRQ